MKKIMILSPHNPFLRSNGGENRIFLLAEEYSKKMNVILVCPRGKISSKKIKVYQPFKDSAKEKTFNFKLIKELRSIIGKEKPDLLQVEFPWQSINLMLLGKRFILDEHNVEFLRFKRTKSKKWFLIYLYELLACKYAKKIICVSRTDEKFINKYFWIGNEKTEVIENPVDKKLFFPNKKNKIKIKRKLGMKNSEKFILFFGQLDYQPNVEAIEVIKNKILPKLDKKKQKYKIVICGKGDGKGILKKFHHKNLIFKGFVNEIQKYVNSADVVIAPLISGSGTRIKILEALACKTRVISTSIGAEGINKNRYLEVEDDWNEFVKKI